LNPQSDSLYFDARQRAVSLQFYQFESDEGLECAYQYSS